MENDIREQKKAKRREYYLKNKSRMNELAKERYKRVRDDPETYKIILEKNHNAYHYKVNDKSITPLSEEEEEDFMRKIISDIKSLREQDEGTKRNKINLSQTYPKWNQIHNLFYN
jgi:hypothetical protein